VNLVVIVLPKKTVKKDLIENEENIVLLEISMMNLAKDVLTIVPEEEAEDVDVDMVTVLPLM
jgi:hypothetical protein